MGQLGSGANSSYPATLDTKQTFANVANPIADSTSRVDAEVLNDILDALIKVETELGVDPAGTETDVASRFVVMHGPWERADVAASQSAVALKLNANNDELVMPRNGSIVAITVASNAARTAGTLTVKPTVNGAEQLLSAVLDAANTQFKSTTQAVGTETFTAGQRIGVKITTDATWAPITADIVVTVYVSM